MNEEVQKELLQLLRDIKAGSPGAWQMIVEQRAGLYGAQGFGFTVLALTLATLAMMAFRFSKNATTSRVARDEGMADAPEVVGGFASIALMIAGLICFGAALCDFATSIAPLGHILDVVTPRK